VLIFCVWDATICGTTLHEYTDGSVSLIEIICITDTEFCSENDCFKLVLGILINWHIYKNILRRFANCYPCQNAYGNADASATFQQDYLYYNANLEIYFWLLLIWTLSGRGDYFPLVQTEFRLVVPEHTEITLNLPNNLVRIFVCVPTVFDIIIISVLASTQYMFTRIKNMGIYKTKIYPNLYSWDWWTRDRSFRAILVRKSFFFYKLVKRKA